MQYVATHGPKHIPISGVLLLLMLSLLWAEIWSVSRSAIKGSPNTCRSNKVDFLVAFPMDVHAMAG